MERKDWLAVVAAFSAGLLMRATVSLYPYSGYGKAPMYGDYEAQRHWQEITINLPIRDWYRNTTDNDLLYWGLDYPPLTAYHSFAMGQWARQKNASFVELHTSRGITDDSHKRFMRNTVLLADALVYMPALVFALFTIRRRLGSVQQTWGKHWPLALALLYPGQILIDNGHFQYNNISLGLAALAIALVLMGRHLTAAALFCMALNYKQMELYHALPFFFYLLRCCFNDRPRLHVTASGLRMLCTLGAVVLGTFAVIWSPWLTTSPTAVQQLVHRIFPVARGVFEDNVASVWCVVNVFIKLRNIPNETMAVVCLLCTAIAILPSGVHLLLHGNGSRFLLSLTVTSLGFFLFSFHVHEKTILLVALPVLLLLPNDPLPSLWFLQISSFSMLPLLRKDGLVGPYLTSTMLTLLLVRYSAPRRDSKSNSGEHLWYDLLHVQHLLNVRGRIAIVALQTFYLSLLGQWVLLVAFLYLPTPSHLPFLYSLLIAGYSCGHFVLFFLYAYYRQFYDSVATITTGKDSDKIK